jgi:hypothetical protein
VEATIAIPAAMFVILVAVQACLWAHASSLVQAAATRGEEAACVVGGSLTGGVTEARMALADTASHIVLKPSVQAKVIPGDQIEVRVSGIADSIVPGFQLPVTATRVGSKQEFRVTN